MLEQTSTLTLKFLTYPIKLIDRSLSENMSLFEAVIREDELINTKEEWAPVTFSRTV